MESDQESTSSLGQDVLACTNILRMRDSIELLNNEKSFHSKFAEDSCSFRFSLSPETHEPRQHVFNEARRQSLSDKLRLVAFDENQTNEPCVINSLHHSSKIPISGRGMVVTSIDFNVLVPSEHFCFLLGMEPKTLVGQNLLDVVESEQLKNIAFENIGEQVLICGNVMRLKLKSKKSFIASVWAKLNKQKEDVIIWIFDEVQEKKLTCLLINDKITDPKGPWQMFPKNDKIQDIIPNFNLNETYFTAFNGKFIPVTLHFGSKLKIFILSTLSGIMTVDLNGTIMSCNAVFCEYFFGYKAKSIINNSAILILPQIQQMISICKNDLPLCIASKMLKQDVYAIHRDGGKIHCDVQIRPLKGNLFSLWVVYNHTEQQSNHVQPCINDYDVIETLGVGATASVVFVREKKSNQERVIKSIQKDKILANLWTTVNGKKLPNEILIMKTLQKINSEYLVNMENVFEDKTHFHVVLQTKGMDLFEFIEQNPDANLDQMQKIFKQVCLGVNVLHSNNICHRDIKDENVILDLNLNAKLGDFGSSAFEGNFDTFYGTLDYCPPEIVLGRKYTGKPQDIWALGILLHIMLFKECPFYNFDEILSRQVRVPSTPQSDLLRKLLNKESKSRVTILQVLEHPWLK